MKDSDAIRQAIGVPRAAVSSVIFGLFLASFPMGAFVVFASGIGGDVNYDLPLTHLGLFEGLDVHRADFPMSVGDVFVLLWVSYAALFCVAAMGPCRGFGRTISDMMSGRGAESGAPNYMMGAITWFSILVLVSFVVIVAQDAAGIQTVHTAGEGPLAEFLYVTLAPLAEELGFRLVLVGIPVFLLYSARFSLRYFASCLWRPSNLDIADTRKALAVVVVTGAMFGLSHIVFGESWSEGKFAQAAAGGIIIGWVYVRFGFVASVVIHWASNYFVFAHAHFISQTHGIAVSDALDHAMIHSIEAILLLCGALSITAMIIASSALHRHARHV